MIAIATSLETGLFEIIFDIANIMGWSGAVSMADAVIVESVTCS